MVLKLILKKDCKHFVNEWISIKVYDLLTELIASNIETGFWMP